MGGGSGKESHCRPSPFQPKAHDLLFSGFRSALALPRPLLCGKKVAMSNVSTINGPELPALGIIENLGDEDRALLCSYGSFQYFESGQVVIAHLAEQDTLYFVLSGELHAKRTVEGREILLGTIRQGESFGEVNIFDPGSASATVQAVTPTQIWKIDRNSLVEFFQAYPEASVALTSRIASILSKRLRALAMKLEDKTEYEDLLSQIAIN